MARTPFIKPALLASMLLLGGALTGQAQTTDVVHQREELLAREKAKQEAQQTYVADMQKAETEVWTPAKVMINLDARCPVVTALGFFGAFASTNADPAKAAEAQAKYAQLLTAAQPISAQLMKIATSTQYVGLTFPPSVVPQLNVLKGQLYEAIEKIYGQSALGDFKIYSAELSAGVVVGLAGTPQ
jgi:hypothetical protein